MEIYNALKQARQAHSKKGEDYTTTAIRPQQVGVEWGDVLPSYNVLFFCNAGAGGSIAMASVAQQTCRDHSWSIHYTCGGLNVPEFAKGDVTWLVVGRQFEAGEIRKVEYSDHPLVGKVAEFYRDSVGKSKNDKQAADLIDERMLGDLSLEDRQEVVKLFKNIRPQVHRALYQDVCDALLARKINPWLIPDDFNQPINAAEGFHLAIAAYQGGAERLRKKYYNSKDTGSATHAAHLQLDPESGLVVITGGQDVFVPEITNYKTFAGRDDVIIKDNPAGGKKWADELVTMLMDSSQNFHDALESRLVELRK